MTDVYLMSASPFFLPDPFRFPTGGSRKREQLLVRQSEWQSWLTGSLIAGVGHGVDRGMRVQGEEDRDVKEEDGHANGMMASRGSFNLCLLVSGSEGRGTGSCLD